MEQTGPAPRRGETGKQSRQNIATLRYGLGNREDILLILRTSHPSWKPGMIFDQKSLQQDNRRKKTDKKCIFSIEKATNPATAPKANSAPKPIF